MLLNYCGAAQGSTATAAQGSTATAAQGSTATQSKERWSTYKSSRVPVGHAKPLHKYAGGACLTIQHFVTVALHFWLCLARTHNTTHVGILSRQTYISIRWHHEEPCSSIKHNSSWLRYLS